MHRLLKQIVGLWTRGNDNLYIKSTQQQFQWMWRLPSGGQSWLLLLLTPSQPAGTSGQFLNYQKNPFPDSFGLLLIFLSCHSRSHFYFYCCCYLFFACFEFCWWLFVFFSLYFFGFFSALLVHSVRQKCPCGLWLLSYVLLTFFSFSLLIFLPLSFLFSYFLIFWKVFLKSALYTQKIWKRPFRKVKMCCRKISHIVHKNREFHADFKSEIIRL